MAVTSWIRRMFKNGVSITDTIPLGITNAAMSWSNLDGSTFPDGSVGPFIVTVDQGLSSEERILMASRSGSVMTVAASGRGYNGTTPQSHAAGCSIFHTMDQQDLDEANQTMFQTLGQVAAKGDLLIGSAANTLTKLSIGTTAQFPQVTGGTLAYVSFGFGQSTSVGTSNTDGTAVNPARADHGHNLYALYAAKGNLVVGTGSGTAAQLTVGTDTYVLTAASGQTTGLIWQYPALTNAAGHLSGDYTLTASLATFMTTASLAVGTWLVSCSGVIDSLTSSDEIELTTKQGTATATFEGAYSCDVINNDASSTIERKNFGMSFIATVTGAGTLIFQAIESTTTGTSLIKATTVTHTYANATGWTAVRIT
jgi:hypothetical protein